MNYRSENATKTKLVNAALLNFIYKASRVYPGKPDSAKQLTLLYLNRSVKPHPTRW